MQPVGRGNSHLNLLNHLKPLERAAQMRVCAAFLYGWYYKSKKKVAFIANIKKKM